MLEQTKATRCHVAPARIRVREVHKLLAYIDSYKSTLPRPPPALICGDFNGEAASTVVQFLKRYGWRCSYSQHAEVCDSADAAASFRAAAAASRSSRWVSHYTHEKEALGVDYIWVLNPSLPRLPVPEWTDFVFSEMAQQLTRQGFYIRSHLLRMPPAMLARHLWTKWRKGHRG